MTWRPPSLPPFPRRRWPPYRPRSPKAISRWNAVPSLASSTTINASPMCIRPKGARWMWPRGGWRWSW